MLHNLKHNKVLHENNLFVTVRSHEVPWIGMNKRVEIEPLGRLTIKVRDELKRTWARETRLDREQKGLKGTTPQLTGKYAKV